MSRSARKESSTGIYHVMIRGNNKQDIFVDDRDRIFFLKTLKECKEQTGFELYAYCLMSNHVHLLIRTTYEPLDRIFKCIGSRYALWFNRRHERIGHLFQDRFKSENVESERYFMTVLRYIIQNPTKAGLENRPGRYRWTCYHEYESGEAEIVDVIFAIEIAGEKDRLLDFIRTVNSDRIMDMDKADLVPSDDDARMIMLRISGCSEPGDFMHMEKNTRKICIREMLAEGLSVSQVVMLTGIPQATVYRLREK